MFTAKIGNTVVSSADSIVISSFMGLTALTMYNNYYYIMSSVSSFVNTIFVACTAGIGNSLITDGMKKNYHDFEILSFIIAWLSGVCVSCFYCIYQPFMNIWVGESLMFGQSVVILFCVYFYLYTLSGVLSTYKDAAGIWHADRYRPLISALLNLALNLAFVQKFGVYAILLSTIISYIFVNIPWLIYNLFHSLFKTEMRQYIKKLVVQVIVNVIACFLSACVCHFVHWDGIGGILCRGVICFVVSDLVLLLAYFRTQEFADCVTLLKRILRKQY